MKSCVFPCGSLVLAGALTACSGVGSSTASNGIASGVPAIPNGPSASAAIRYGAETTQGAIFQGEAAGANVSFGVLVEQQNANGLIAYAHAANDPSSGSYRHWLSPQDIANRFGASQTDYAKVAAYFRSKGLGVASWAQRELLFVSGPRTAAEAALGAHFGSFTKNGVTFTALRSAPAGLRGLPIASLGVSTYSVAKRAREFVRSAGGPPSGAGYSPAQIAAAFDYTGAYNAGFTGRGITIGIVGTGPISAADYTSFRKMFNVPGTSTVTQVNVTDAGTAGTPAGYGGQPPAGTFTAPPPTTDFCLPQSGPDAACNPEDFEAQIDTEQTFSLARDAAILFYLAYEPAGTAGNTGTSNLEGLPLSQFEIQQAINDDVVDVLSLSYGEGELDDNGVDFELTGNTVDFTTSQGPLQFAALAAEGVAVFAASGDTGDLDCLRDAIAATASDKCVLYPAIDPSVVGVGGVTAPIGPNGRLTGPITGWGAQTGLYDPVLGGASGGGISAYFPQPAFQTGAVSVTGSTRNSPDVSLDADSHSGVATIYDAAYPDAGIGGFGGTSVAAPETAAMWALVLQACAQNPATCKGTTGGAHAYRLGDPNALFYTAYKTSSTYAATFYDVVFGDNSQLPCSPYENQCPSPQPTPIAGYIAGVGYDRITGLGVPFGRALIKTIAGI